MIQNTTRVFPNSIIIIQSDHGTLSSSEGKKGLHDVRPEVIKERTRNYSAIYLPEYCDRTQLYDSMTPVNTFRVIFNSCFDTEYGLLEDIVYYDRSGPAGYQNFKDVSDIVLEK